MDSIIPLGQKNTLAKYMILSGADNHPPMLYKGLYASWKSKMELYMQNREHRRMILELVENDPLIWPTVEENGVTRRKKYVELCAVEKIQADCDMKATNIILQGLPGDIYSLVNHHRVAKDLWKRVQLLMQGSPQPTINLELPLIQETKPLFKMAGSQCNKFREDNVKVILALVIRVMLLVLGETMLVDRQGLLNATTVKVKDIWLGNALSLSNQGMQHDPGVPDGQAVQIIILNNAAFQTKDLDTYDSDYDDISNAKAVLMANISNYGSDVISEVPHSETYLNDMENQSVHAMQDFEQTPAEKANKEQNSESVTAELERYKERVKTFEQRLNIDLSSREKMIDSQMDDMIKEKLALKEQVDSLEQNLSKQIKEKECLLQTFTVFKNESKEKENKYMVKIIDLEKKIKELDNIIFKVGQSAQTVHIKPSDASPIKIEAHKELPKGSLVNESLKKLKFHLVRFDNVVKIRTTPNARTEDLLNEIMEVQTVFDQMDAVVQQSSVDKQFLDIAKKELLLENDRLLQQIMSQDVLLTVKNSMSLLSVSIFRPSF
ncbi:hypothetical protein Tco_0585467 [Tanacetum coccineum]